MRTLGVRETWYFGLQFVDKKDIVTWLKFNKKVSVDKVNNFWPKGDLVDRN